MCAQQKEVVFANFKMVPKTLRSIKEQTIVKLVQKWRLEF